MREKYDFLHEDNIRVLYRLVVSLLVIVIHHQSTQNSKFVMFQKKKWGLKLIFCIQINIKLSHKLIPLILGMTRPAQITQNNKFAKSLQYLKESEGWRLFLV